MRSKSTCSHPTSFAGRLRCVLPIALAVSPALAPAQDIEGYVIGAAELTPVQQLGLSGRAAIGFGRATSLVAEGNTRIEVRVGFDRPYQGTIEWEVGGSAIPGIDYVVSATSMSVDGLGADIAIDLLDDDLIEPQTKTIELRLKSNAAYDLAAPLLHTVYLEDNDRVWDVVVTRGYLKCEYLLEVVVDGVNASGNLVSVGSGTLPAGSYALGSMHFDADSFGAQTQPIPTGAETLLFRRPMERVIELNAQPQAGYDSVTPDFIQGESIERFRAVDAGDRYLDRTFTGLMVMTRRPLVTPADPPNLNKSANSSRTPAP